MILYIISFAIINVKNVKFSIGAPIANIFELFVQRTMVLVDLGNQEMFAGGSRYKIHTKSRTQRRSHKELN